MTVISALFYVLPRIYIFCVLMDQRIIIVQQELQHFSRGEILPQPLSPLLIHVQKKNSFKSVLENFSSTAVLTERAQEQDEQGANQCNLATKLNLTQCQKISESPGHAYHSGLKLVLVECIIQRRLETFQEHFRDILGTFQRLLGRVGEATIPLVIPKMKPP